MEAILGLSCIERYCGKGWGKKEKGRERKERKVVIIGSFTERQEPEMGIIRNSDTLLEKKFQEHTLE